MEYIYAAMLLHKVGKKVDEAHIKKVLVAAGVKVDASRVKALIAALDSVDIDKAITEAAPVASVAPAPSQDAPAGDAKPKAAEKKEEPKEEKKSEEDAAAGLGALFG